MSIATNRPFAEVIQSSIHSFTAQSWQWNEFPAYGSLLCAQVEARMVFAIVHDVKTGSIDPSRRPFTYQKTPQELASEQPQIFALLQTSFICQVVGYLQERQMYYLLAPAPLPIHTFVQPVEEEACVTFFSSFQYVHILFAFSEVVQNIDELLLSLIQQNKAIFGEDEERLLKFMKVYSLLTGNDYRRIKLFLQRVQSLLCNEQNRSIDSLS